MAISSHFQDQINLVDATKVLTFIVDPTYEEFQFSYNGLECRGGTDLACEYAASELLEAMGYRFYSPQEWGTVRPATIPTGLSISPTTFWMPTNAISLVYGHSWSHTLSSSRTLLNDAHSKWEILNGLFTMPWPAGHRWGNVISNNIEYFRENPDFIKGGYASIDTESGSSAHFDLVGLVDSGLTERYDELVHICAAHLLWDGLNEWNRTNFDPSDSDSNPSDYVFPFTKAVAEAVRAGTEAIADIPAQAGVPEAMLGLYAYAGHRLPPTLSVAPEVYTQVALAFNSTNLSFEELVTQHGAKAAAVLLREYWDTEVWSMSQPFEQIVSKNYNNMYSSYQAAGAIGVNAEYAANWLVNLVGVRHFQRQCKTGTYSYEEALDDVLENLFDNEPTVRELYEFWSVPTQRYNLFNLRYSFDRVNAMPDSWYKTYYQYALTILAELHYLPDQIPLLEQTPADPFPAAFSSMMAHVTAVRELDIMHSYAFMRQQANSAVSKNYPQLKWPSSSSVPLANVPDWHTNSYLPTEADFDSWYAILLADTVREEILDTDNYAIVRGVPSGSTATRTDKINVTAAALLYVGPGELTVTKSGIPTATKFGPGLHHIGTSGTITWSGGLLFVDTFPKVRKDPLDGMTGKNWFLYVQNSIAGIVTMRAGSRWRFIDESGQFDLLPVTSGSYVSPANLGPGQVRVEEGNTRGDFFNDSANRYLSPDKNIVLTTHELVAQEWGNTPKLLVKHPVVVEE